MREILFRGKRIDNGEWVEGFYLILPMSEIVIPETVGQFTGLTDKNGKKILEGDICEVVYLDRRLRSNGEHYDVENVMIAEVVFEKGAFCFKTTFEDIALYRPIGFSIYWMQKVKYFEVIGNIHDNPELLKGTNSADDAVILGQGASMNEKQIKAKAIFDLPLTKKEEAYYLLFMASDEEIKEYLR